jgi:hypothetical protein
MGLAENPGSDLVTYVLAFLEGSLLNGSLQNVDAVAGKDEASWWLFPGG